ncbi:MAG: cytochrome c oxidase, subunit [Phycisphaerales bacterium]|nr:cytochrome c oxidase, subunit [Phycisphaerales bacterium]
MSFATRRDAASQTSTSAWCAGRVGCCVLIGLVASGCAGEMNSPESVLDPAGPQSRQIGGLTWLFIWTCVIVFFMVMGTLVGALAHRRKDQAMGPSREPITHPDPIRERRLWTTVWASIVLTVGTLFTLLFADLLSGRAIHKVSQSPDPLRIQIIAHQWWWEVHYIDWPARFGERSASNGITTANEIHIPVDPAHPVTVEFELDSHDVIHSFWVPNLHGKRDIIPGHPTSLWLQADRPGTYWGECGEFCGYQHAQMRLVVVAEPAEKFQSWLDGQRQSAPEPTGEMQARGRDVFLHASCAMCHSIQGTDAHASVGPDLTHVASRKILAAGAVPNMPGHLAGWIMDPQRIKPGTRMPQNNLSAGDLRALLEYIETLK